MNQAQRNYLIMRAIYKARKKIYFFNAYGIYSSISEKELSSSFLKGISVYEDGTIYIWTTCYEYGCDSKIVAMMALSKLREGDTIKRFEELLETCKPAPKNSLKPQGIDAFICKIDSPIFYRDGNNPRKNTFDYIYIDVSILSETAMENRDTYIKENISEIRQKVAEKLNNSREFKKYGIPINFLRVCRTTLKKKSNVLQFVFELKNQ